MPLRLCVLLMIVYGSIRPVLADVLYTVTGIPAFSGDLTTPTGINNAGQVAGTTHSPLGVRAWVYSGGQIIDLGTLGGSFTYTGSINNLGQVAGSSQISNAPGAPYHAFLYSTGQITDLTATLNLPGSYPAVYINDVGQITGRAAGGRAFLYSSGQFIDLGTLGGSTNPSSINNLGQVVGASQISNAPGAPYHAFLYSNGELTDLHTLLGSVAGGFSEARGINNAGQVTGDFNVSNSQYSHAFLYGNGQIMDLGTLPGGLASMGLGINDEGQVVGESAFFGGGHAFLYTDGQMLDLNNLIARAPGIPLEQAIGINDNGQIIATDGHSQAYLLTPVPEPVSFAMFAAGICVIAALKSRKRAWVSAERS